MNNQWQPGDAIVHRYVGHENWITWGRPHVVVVDTPDLIALYQPEGTVIERFDRKANVFLNPMTVRMNILRLMYPGRAHAVLLFWDAGTGVPPWYQKQFSQVDGDFKGWKIDLESPFNRTQWGVDTTDNMLDVIIHPDFSWFWKDEENLAACAAEGIFTVQEVKDFYGEGRRAIQAVERRDPPFSEPWPEWRPDPTWLPPQCPTGWEAQPGAFIDLNRQAVRPFQRRRTVQ